MELRGSRCFVENLFMVVASATVGESDIVNDGSECERECVRAIAGRGVDAGGAAKEVVALAMLPRGDDEKDANEDEAEEAAASSAAAAAAKRARSPASLRPSRMAAQGTRPGTRLAKPLLAEGEMSVANSSA